MKHVIEDKKESLTSAIKVKWIDGVRFVANDDKGHSVIMDASKEQGGEGSAFSPMQLLLAALGGCTGIDVVGIMRKQRQKVTSLEIHVSGERVAEHPRVYSKVHVEYRLKGEGLRENAVQRAIQLSEDTYCSVGATIKRSAQITYDYTLQ